MTPQLPLPPFLAACRQRARPADRVKRIDTICIPTANRVATFARAARSYLTNAQVFGRSPELVVADDSADRAVREEYRRLLVQLAQEFSVSVFYAGLEEKQTYIGHLARESSVPPALIEFALLDPLKIGYHPGANRNALLLQTAGRAFFGADDDTICRPVTNPAKPWSMRLGDAGDPTTIQPYESFAQLEQELTFTATDLLGEHERVLGSDIGSLLTEKPDVAVEIRHPAVLRAIQENAPRIALSWNGIAGDCGYRIPGFLFNLPEPAMQRFTQNEDSYRRMLASRQIHRTCDRLTITPGGYCQSTALAFDNRRPLPPWMPVFRGEDMIFGHVLKLFQPNAAIAYQPTSLLHVPEVARTHSGDFLTGIAEHRSQAGLILALLQLSANAAKQSGPPDLGTLARRAREILDGDLFELLATSTLHTEAEQIIRTSLAQLLARPAAPAFWRKDLESIIRALRTVTTTQTYIYPAELTESRPASDCAQVLKAAVAGYFDLLAAWPTLWSAAVKLRENGITPARRVGPI
ncbi:MAG: hypothetical protein RL324_2014 [Verrucomicrobiota bacterium]|jgi:hypothetical protein